VAAGLQSAAEDAGLLGLLEESLQGGERLGKWSLRVRIVVVSRKNYYNNSLGDIVHGASYRNNIFSTQIALELLKF
jgi:hypothetical protein